MRWPPSTSCAPEKAPLCCSQARSATGPPMSRRGFAFGVRLRPMTSLSVLVPVYNEEHLVSRSLSRLEVLETSPDLERIQVIVVDDCSTDRTPERLRRF